MTVYLLCKLTKLQINLKKIKYLQILFKEEITIDELPKFRGAVIDAASTDKILFHNHLGDQFRYSYPLIQYKRLGKKAALVCLEQGTEEIYAFFSRPNQYLRIGEREIQCQIDRLILREINLQVTDYSLHYRIERWLAVKDDNFRAFSLLKTEREKKDFLEKMMIGNILSMAKGLGWFIDKPIEVKIAHILRQRNLLYKETLLTGFDVEFSCNVFLPDFIGLGKSPAMGFGIVRKVRQIDDFKGGKSKTQVLTDG